MRIEVVNTGTELLLGQVVNTHAAYFGQELFPLGHRVQRQTCIPDGDTIATVLRECFGRTDAILVTGGLGPTSDDVTREVVADLLEMPLRLDESIVRRIEAIFGGYGRTMPDSNRRQAMVPEGAIVMPNDHGTAPGLHLPARPGHSPHLFLLPGPPRELKPMFEGQVLPKLRELSPPRQPSYAAFRIVGVGESAIAEALEAPLQALGEVEIGYCARLGEVDLRVIGPKPVIDVAGRIVDEHFAAHVVNRDGRSMEQTVVDLLTEAGETVCTAESCTGGLLANKITDVPGASAVLLEGFVTYSNAAKIARLGVPEALLEAHGAVSEPVARAMVEGALERSGATHALSITGVAGPGGGSEEKPVGTVFIAQANRGAATFASRFRFHGDRTSFKERTARMALELLRRRLRSLPLDI